MKQLFYAVILMATVTFSQAQNQLPALKLEEFSEGYDQPLGIENAGDSRLFIVEKPGRIWICDEQGNKSAQPFLDISAKVFSEGDEQGLLGLAFHPEYAMNGFFYVDYINTDENITIARYTVSGDPNSADPLSEEILLVISHPWPNHNGGCIRFGPDGYLYISTGDGGRGGDPLGNAQNPGSLLGKMLRIDVNSGLPYAIPPTNPFVNSALYAPEIWALGLRNPWRFSFDKKNGNLWIGDVGQNKWEEIDFQQASSPGGENYGWDCAEGHHVFPLADCTPDADMVSPIVEYPHNGDDCTVIGGFVYRGTEFPTMAGKYIYCDFCSGKFRTIFRMGGVIQNEVILDEESFEYTAFGEDANGELYTADIAGGEILHLIDTSGLKVMSPQVNEVNLYPNPNNGQFTVEWTASTDDQSEIEVVNIIGQQQLKEKIDMLSGTNTWTFSKGQLAQGEYLLFIRSTAGVTQTKFTVE